MKKTICLVMAAALLGAALTGCEKKEVPEPSTEPVVTQAMGFTENWSVNPDEDMALPQVNDTGSTTAPLVTKPTTTKKFQEAPIMQAIANAQNSTPAPATTTTTTTAPSTTAEQPQDEPEQPAASTSTTAAPTTAEPTTVKQGTPEQLNNNVLRYINSGTYTETISAFGNDHKSEDQLSKIVRGGQTAYWITIPATGLTFKTFPSGGKYYLATPTKYCELTKEQYDGLCKSLNNAFCNFSVLTYEKTETVRDGIKSYTCEYFNMNGSTLVLWFKNNALTKMQLVTAAGTESLPMTVSGNADASYFTLNDGLEKVDYATLESLVSLAGVFFG